MIRHATYELATVLALMETRTRGKVKLPDGHVFKPGSARLQLFKLKGLDCVTCGAQGAFFALESAAAETPHLNLYARNGKGEEVLMTKDHIKPKARGGENAMDNYQPMCVVCNGKKADREA